MHVIIFPILKIKIVGTLICLPFSVYGRDKLSDAISFAVTSKKVTSVLQEYSADHAYHVQIFPENYFTFKSDALNHNKLKDITGMVVLDMKLFVADSVSNCVWLLTNSYVIKMSGVEIPNSPTIVDLAIWKTQVTFI